MNNVETLVNIPFILERGADAYAALGTPESTGTKALCLNRGFARPGIVEVEFGTSVAEVLDDGGGGRAEAALEAVLLGGPMGSILFPESFDTPICFGAMEERGIELGHGGLIAVTAGSNWRAILEGWLRFMQEESCGKCAPCALGSARLTGLVANSQRPTSRHEVEELLNLIEETSLCGFGRQVPRPLKELIHRFGDELFSPTSAR